ncbi:aminotransferase yhxA [Ectobacillus ponti]|uniref:Aminotransferase yhxA n=1 Tax=Ectobacillus ponti TaxID=2961894 RepID=A0AA41XDD3_9BACI|nr:aminotransferase yhxA [Ectobacillus ponti]MCP8970808.1 aminotransferase yhxA [Ectobacillus ponti]
MKRTTKVMLGVMAAVGGAGCSSDDASLPPKPTDPECGRYEFDYDDGVWECEDTSSSHYGHSYHGGKYYSSKSKLYSDSGYQSYRNSAAFKSGFGSGSKSSGS